MTKTRVSRATLDRIEDDVAVLIVEGREVTRPLTSLPSGVREGDVLDLETMRVDAEATEALREEVRMARQQAMQGKKPPAGNFDL
ncbi:DUF3006 domain-containing protein [Myxococcus llanfairpwllgwyngyllgogerychwyrndrobwllllantysiliogogogochensis]|uniref:DUF3006 domain-containing protein n=1 Tax=Myxococcus llanfairpwllgwyngyllgogerychwyrndrobwllllantysiliogogogochensis TaxID=2590453 RepID=A0A540WHW3_9BACT|nr:DUF3006 domain-containing protein [Myxococcus llanfairpwllgwyngyllgogerychwyrndrobwllllantysiliogogogochensis]TQF08610.1 DUF3006 domain-containing protein [Myxococcus llanfairpwllgwyngyllgogerychwyrndrobwllllantysiliogogogochensis]